MSLITVKDGDTVFVTTVQDEADMVSHPPHYTRAGIECIDAIEAAIADLPGAEAFLTAQVIKYIWRWKWKNGAEDLKKCRWYLNRLIEKTERIKGTDAISTEQEDK